jgi:hypothetical protein
LLPTNIVFWPADRQKMASPVKIFIGISEHGLLSFTWPLQLFVDLSQPCECFRMQNGLVHFLFVLGNIF